MVLDEDAVGPPDKQGPGAKILRGEGALEQFLSKSKKQKEPQVIEVMELLGVGSA